MHNVIIILILTVFSTTAENAQSVPDNFGNRQRQYSGAIEGSACHAGAQLLSQCNGQLATSCPNGYAAVTCDFGECTIAYIHYYR